MSAFLVDESFDMPVRDEPEFDASVLDPRAPWMGDSSRARRRQVPRRR